MGDARVNKGRDSFAMALRETKGQSASLRSACEHIPLFMFPSCLRGGGGMCAAGKRL